MRSPNKQTKGKVLYVPRRVRNGEPQPVPRPFLRTPRAERPHDERFLLQMVDESQLDCCRQTLYLTVDEFEALKGHLADLRNGAMRGRRERARQ